MRKTVFVVAMALAASPSLAGVAFTKAVMEFDYERRYEEGYTRIKPSELLQSALLGTMGSLTSDCVQVCRGGSGYNTCSSMFGSAETNFNSLEGYYYQFSPSCGDGATMAYSGSLGSDLVSFRWIYPKGTGDGGAPILNPIASAAISACNDISTGELNNIKGIMTGAAVVSGIGAAGNIAASAGNVYGAVKNAQADKAAAADSANGESVGQTAISGAIPVAAAPDGGLKPGEAFKGQQMMNAITAGVGAAAGTTSTIINAASAGKLGRVIDQIESCKTALGKVTAAASDSASLEQQMAASNSKSDAKSACNKISVSDIKSLKGAMIAAAVVSGIGAAGNIAASAGNVYGAVKNVQADKAAAADSSGGEAADVGAPDETAVAAHNNGLKPGESFKGQNIVNVASAGVGAATGATSTAMSAIAASKLDKIIADIEKCRGAASQL